MNLDSLSFALTQISHLVSNLTKKNYKSSQTEITSLIETHGFEAERHLYRCLFSLIDFNSDSNKTTGKDYHQTQYLKENLNSLLSKLNFLSILTFSIDQPLQFQESIKTPSNLLSSISKTLKLNKLQEIAFAIALQRSSKDEISRKSSEYLKQKFTDLLNPYSDIAKELNFDDVSIETLQLILTELSVFIKSNPSLNTIEFYNRLRKDFSEDKIAPLLLNYIYPDGIHELKDHDLLTDMMPKKIDIPVEAIQEIGYNFTSSLEDCKNIVSSFGYVKDVVTPAFVARVLGMMARTHGGLHTDMQTMLNPSTYELKSEKDMLQQAQQLQTWNIDVFCQAIQELLPTFQWKEIVKEFDYPEFILKDKVALRIIVHALKRTLRDTFPIEYLYRVWKNTEGQLSWFIQSLKHPDVFCIAEYQCRRTVTESLKAQPEDDNRLIASWKSLSLIETLLLISDTGIYSPCMELFKFPVTHCPDLLLLGLLQLNNIWNKMKQDLISLLIPIFLNNHPNSAVILQYTWNQSTFTTQLRTIIMNLMAEWYMKTQDAEQSSRLARILDVSQDLKALFILLNGQPLIFTIDLACLAARRGYLKLDKWMSDRMRDHGELFISTVVSFLRKKMPQLNKDEQNLRPSQTPLLPDTAQTILKCIGGASGSVSAELQQEIIQINNEIRLLLDKPGIMVGGVQKPPQANPGTFDLLQTMMNFNINANNANFNSPGKILTPPIGVQTNPLQQLAATMNTSSPSIQSTMPNYTNANMLLNNNLDSNKAAVLNSILTNHRIPNYNTNLMRPLNSPQLHTDMLDANLQGLNYTKELEEEVEKCIQRLFKGIMSVDEFCDILARFKDSHDKKEKDFYTYALKYLIDGNTCLYSLDEMQFITMSSTWGVMIDRGILSNSALSYCLKLILQMLNKPVNTKYSVFSIKVLDRCKNRLKDYPEFCQWMMQLVNYQELPKILKEYVEYGVRNMLPPIAQQGNLPGSMRPQTPPINLQFGSGLQAQQQQQLQRQMSANPVLNSQLSNKGQLQSQAPSAHISSSPNLPIGLNPLQNLNASSSHTRSASAKPSIANTTNIDTLLVANENDMSAKPTPPPEQIQDKIGFIFNNLSLSNIQVKSDELVDALKDDFWDWIAHYLVVKRCSIEPNFHALYSTFLDTIKHEHLNQKILIETYKNIRVLLRSDKNDQKYCDRALLKNLGSWLGLITLAKNKPILQRDIDLKSLTVEAFQKGQAELLFVVPFVAKVLDSASKSRIFQPPNPWLLSMISLLVELHDEPELKLNNKFEIEVLCKNLNINILEVPVKNVLRNFEIIEEQLVKRKDPLLSSTVAHTASSVATTQQMGLNAQTSSLSMSIPQQQQQASLQQADASIVSTTGMYARQQQQPTATYTPPDAGSQIPFDPMSFQSNQPTNAANAYVVPTPMPKYKLSEIKIANIMSNQTLVFINPDIPLLNAHPGLKSLIVPTIDRAVSDMLPMLLDKAVKISVSTAEPLIKKDFSLDPDESHMKVGARNMVANMSSGMMLITGKEPLSSHLFTLLQKQLTQPLDLALANAFKDMIAQACTQIVQDNIELCMCFLQKNAIQKAIIELEKKLQPEFEMRIKARSEGRPHYDANVFAYQNEKMPETIRIRLGMLSQQQFSVYEEFGKNLPGFKSHTDEKTNFNQAVDEMTSHYDRLISALEAEYPFVQPNHILASNLQELIAFIHDFKQTQTPISASNLVRRLVYNLLDNKGTTTGGSGLITDLTQTQIPNDSTIITRYREANLGVLKIILGDQRFVANNWIVKEVQKIWIECTQDFKYSVEGIAILFKLKLLSVQTVDLHIAHLVDNSNPKAIQFAAQLIKFFFIEHASMFTDIDFQHLMDSVNKAAANSRTIYQNSDLRDVIEVVRMNYDTNSLNDRICAAALSMMYTGVTQARDFDDPPGLKEKSEQLLHEWITHHSLLPNKENTKAFQQFVLQMNTQGLFKTDDMITRFFRICTESCVEACYMNLSKGHRQLCYHRLDAFVKLIILLVKHSGDQTNHINKINLFNKVLGLIAGCLLYDFETKGTLFEPMPFHRLLYTLLYEATIPENNLEPIMSSILQAFVNVFHIIRPVKAPGFAYQWLELISHRIFISRMLQVAQPIPDQANKAWNMYANLLIQLLRFTAPFIRNVDLQSAVSTLYKGLLRTFLVLLHDFPEFLCSCHYQFCDIIPPNCIQLRNLVLSAFPLSMKLPDPLTPNLKVEMIGDIDSSSPKITYPFTFNIPVKLKNDIDSYVKTRAPVTFLSELRSYLQTSPDPGSHYNIQLINALVMYVGTSGILALRQKNLTPSLNTLTHAIHSAHSDIFQSLVADLDSEGRYLFINAIANQLRYPNSHTHYFGCALLSLFSEANSEAIQEQITRVLLERLIVNRPHPWGLLVTFIELIKNPQFKFSSHSFVHCSPEIEKLFQSLGRNCMKV